jgi:hypothetical protein
MERNGGGPARTIFAALIGLALLLTLVGCVTSSTEPVEEESPIHNPWPDEQAEILALLASDEVVAPSDLYETIHQDLERISSLWCDTIPLLCTDPTATDWSWCDSVPLLCTKVLPAYEWVVGKLSIQCDDTTFLALQEGRYEAWNALNQYYGLDTITFSHSRPSASLYFVPRLNPTYLVAQYEALPGIVSASSDGLGGDWSKLTLSISGDARIYTFRLAWGDCLAGCIWEHFWEIRAQADSITLLAEWGDAIPSGQRICFGCP